MAGFGKRRGSMSRADRRKQTERDKLDATPPWEVNNRAPVDATEGPWDVADAPDDDHERVDLGALRLPKLDGIDIQADADAEGKIATVRLIDGGTQMQVGVFAAPRAEGIWDEIRAELATSLTSGGGTAADHEDGEFGTELRGELAATRGSRTPVRFLGVDGPRWFLRAMLVGPGAQDDTAAKNLLNVFRETVVVRGREPLPVRDPVPLHMPKAGEADTDGSGSD